MEDMLMVPGLFAAIFTFIGVIFLSIGYRYSSQRKGWKAIKGVIVKNENEVQVSNTLAKNAIQTPDHHPTVQYTVNGKIFRSTSEIHQNPSLPIGKKVDVLYNPEDPAEALIDTFIQRGTFFVLIGALFLVIGLISALVFFMLFAS